MTPGPEDLGWLRRRQQEGRESRAKQNTEKQSRPKNADSFLARRLQQGRESRKQKEINLQQETERKARQEQAGKQLAGRGAGGFGWEVAAGAGAAGLGVLWTLGKAVQYALLGWELGPDGFPKIDKQSIAHVEKWHNKVAGIKG